MSNESSSGPGGTAPGEGAVARPRRLIPLPIALALAIAIVVVSIGGCIAIVPGCLLHNSLKAGGGALSGAAKALAENFHLRTEVVHGGTVQVYESSRPVREYAVLEEIVHREKSWNVTGWFFQQKGVDTQQRVRAKYGFDLEKGTMRLQEDAATGKITVIYPEPELLSVEVLDEDWARHDSLFNKVTDEDIKGAQDMLRSSGREELARDTSRLAKAREVFEGRVREAMKARGLEVDKFETVAPGLMTDAPKTSPTILPP